MAKRNGALAYFREHLHDVTDGCMIWPYSTNRGYGQVWIDGRFHRVHVLACEAHSGPRPSPAHEAAHGPCHNQACWNGRHLSWKTRAENEADKVRDGTLLQGEAHGSAKLTVPEVLAIRAAALAGTPQRPIAAAFGVSQVTVSRIVRRTHWSHV